MSKALTNVDIVITGLQPWDTEIGSNCKDIATELSRNNRILYVNRALDRITLLRWDKVPWVHTRMRVIRGQQEAVEQVSENLWVLNPPVLLESINFLPNGWLYNWLNKRNNRLVAREVRKVLSDLGFKDVVLFNDNDFNRSFFLGDMIPNVLSIYYIRDFLTGQRYFRKHSQLEGLLMQKSDLVMANSEFLANYGRESNDHSYFVGQGFDQSMIVPSQDRIPDDMVGINGPIVGYLGSLTSKRLEIDLIEYMATNLKDYCIVLVGPEDKKFQESRLHGIPNVIFLGAKPPSKVSNYINSFDVCINPQIINNLTIGNYPRKLDEYLILGKPVVASRTEATNYFEKFIYVCDSAEDCVNKIKLAIEEDSLEKQSARKEFAKGHTWENSIELMRRAVMASTKPTEQ